MDKDCCHLVVVLTIPVIVFPVSMSFTVGNYEHQRPTYLKDIRLERSYIPYIHTCNDIMHVQTELVS